MTESEARVEARRRWGPSGAIRLRPDAKNSGTGRLARYRCMVGNGGLGKACSIEGQGDTWLLAFADARQVR